eukprot:scaffold40556_cov33-Phaeocystis_antarctica.AAC.1
MHKKGGHLAPATWTVDWTADAQRAAPGFLRQKGGKRSACSGTRNHAPSETAPLFSNALDHSATNSTDAQITLVIREGDYDRPSQGPPRPGLAGRALSTHTRPPEDNPGTEDRAQKLNALPR